MAPDSLLGQRVRHAPRLGSRKACYLVYTICFIVFATAAFWYIAYCGKTLIWKRDGMSVHYTSFVYMGQWLRALFSTGQIPMWDFTMGYGSDILAFMSDAGWFADPFNFLSALCPVEYAENLFAALVVVRLYLAGIAFLVFARHRRYDGFGSLCGALAYAFCGFCLFWGAFRHPTFINAAILLPLVLSGVDRIFEDNRPGFFMAFYALSFVINFYFAWMISLFVLLYCLYCYFLLERKRSVRDFFALFGKFVLYIAVSILASAIILLPLLYDVTGVSRVGSYESPRLFFSPYRYASIISTSASFDFTVLCALALLVTAKHGVGKENRPLLIAFIVLTVMTLLPFFGHIFNGFSYSNDRWTFGYAMLCSCIVAKVVPQLDTLTVKNWRAILVIGLVMLVIAAAIAKLTSLTATACIGPVLLICMAVALSRLYFKRGMGAGTIVIPLCIFISIGWMSYFFLSQDVTTGKAYVDDMQVPGYTTEKMWNGVEDSMLSSAALDDSLYRADQYGIGMDLNEGILQKRMFVNYYTNISSPYVFQWRNELALLPNTMQDQVYRDNDSRAMVEAISGVKYFAIKEGKTQYLPCGFTEAVAAVTVDDGSFSLYKTASSLPLAFGCQYEISAADYDALTPFQKQEALLQGCVVDSSSLPEASLELTSNSVSYTVEQPEEGSGIEVSEGRIVVTKAGAEATLDFKGLANSETYLYLSGIKYSPIESVGSILSNGSFSLKEKLSHLKASINQGNTDDFKLKVTCGAMKGKSISTSLPGFNNYAGVSSWAVNCGYSKDAQSKITITFEQEGTYTFDSMEVVCQPMDNLASDVSALQKDSATGLSIGTNSISGSIDADTQELLFVSVPYSIGWTATLDGSPAEVKRADTAFMAIEVPAGTHDFRLSYETPYLRLGAGLSAAGLAGIIAVVVLSSRRRRRREDAVADKA